MFFAFYEVFAIKNAQHIWIVRIDLYLFNVISGNVLKNSW